jgi:hypothetical protein
MRAISLLALSLLAMPAAADFSWQGVWVGTTSQQKPISITVNAANAIPTFSFDGRSTGMSCTVDHGLSAFFPSPLPAVTNGGAFGTSQSSTEPGSVSFNLNGMLNIDGSGSGSISFSRVGFPGQPGASGCNGSGTATFTVSRQGGPPGKPAAILAVVGSVQGAAFFRTGVQIHNPSATDTITGRFVFHPQGASGSANDPFMVYTLLPGRTTNFPDLLPAMNLSGLGSLDIVTSDPVPIVVARVFSDAGAAGTAGFTIDPLPPSAALKSGESGVIIVPPDLSKTRLNIGLRSLDGSVTMVIALRRSNGAIKGFVTKTMGPNYFEQPSVAALLPGHFIEGSDTITFTISSGNGAIIYGASTENSTQDPSLQYAKKTF